MKLPSAQATETMDARTVAAALTSPAAGFCVWCVELGCISSSIPRHHSEPFRPHAGAKLKVGQSLTPIGITALKKGRTDRSLRKDGKPRKDRLDTPRAAADHQAA